MLKRDELEKSDSCLNKARDDERIFVLLARDPAAPTAIRQWCSRRVELGKNRYDDPQIKEALQCAEQMECSRDALRSALADAAKAGET